jgi:hypothetical protein
MSPKNKIRFEKIMTELEKIAFSDDEIYKVNHKLTAMKMMLDIMEREEKTAPACYVPRQLDGSQSSRVGYCISEPRHDDSPFDGHFNPHPSADVRIERSETAKQVCEAKLQCDPELAKLLTPYPEYDEPENDHKNE